MESKAKQVKNGTRTYLIMEIMLNSIQYLKMVQKQLKNMEYIVKNQKVEELKRQV